MDRKNLAAMLVGVVAALLGLMWFLQGTGFLRICPVLCFVDCECITGKSQLWTVAGGIAFIIGIIIIGISLKRAKF